MEVFSIAIDNVISNIDMKLAKKTTYIEEVGLAIPLKEECL